MNKKELVMKLRRDYSSKLRPLLIKDECECCGSTDRLELHHDELFIKQLSDAFHELNIDNKDDYDENELLVIRRYMLGKQLLNINVTLCGSCHAKFHNENGKIKCYKYNTSIYNGIKSDTDFLYTSPKICNMAINNIINATDFILYIILSNSKKPLCVRDLHEYTIYDFKYSSCISNTTLRKTINNLLKLKLINKTKNGRDNYYSSNLVKTKNVIKIPIKSLYLVFNSELSNTFYKYYVLLLYMCIKKCNNKTLDIKQETLSNYLKCNRSNLSEIVGRLETVRLINIIKIYEEGSKKVVSNNYEFLYI